MNSSRGITFVYSVISNLTEYPSYILLNYPYMYIEVYQKKKNTKIMGKMEIIVISIMTVVCTNYTEEPMQILRPLYQNILSEPETAQQQLKV